MSVTPPEPTESAAPSTAAKATTAAAGAVRAARSVSSIASSTAAGAAAGGGVPGAVVGLAKGLGTEILKSRRGRKALLTAVGIPLGVIVLVAALIVGMVSGSPSSATQASTVHESLTVTMASADLDKLGAQYYEVLRDVGEQRGVPWEVLGAIAQVESVSTPDGATGPMGIDLDKADGKITETDAKDLTKAASFIAAELAAKATTTVDNLPNRELDVAAVDHTTDTGAMVRQEPSDDQGKADAAESRKQWVAAIGSLPLAGNPGAADDIYTTARQWALGQASSCTGGGTALDGDVAMGGTTSAGDLNAKQKKYAQAIINQTAAMGLPSKAAIIAISTALQESTLQMYWNAAVPGSKELSDGGPQGGFDLVNLGGAVSYSVGLFQQQVHGAVFPWGTVQDAMSPTRSAMFFLNALKAIPGWESLPVTVAAQRVQSSAFPEAYAKWEPIATQLVHDLKPTVGATPSPDPTATASADPSATATSSPEPTGGATGAPAADTPASAADSSGCSGGGVTGIGTGASGKDDDYPYKSAEPDSFADPWGLYVTECVSFVAWRMNQQMGWKKGADYPFTMAKMNLAGRGNAQYWRDGLTSKGYKADNDPTPGSIAWYGSYGAPGIGEAGHVGEVKKKYPDGSIDMEQYNAGPKWHAYSVWHLPKGAANWPNAFIHVADLK
ncbi:CHAP domain-containing protein [Tersicoccus sp. MR15.9]|uniref:CHAP domain-containing protein n=1 Tax=Tersicoccus mangrovi TaxID=3121635 RepID=UPI002FE5B8A5